MDFDDTKADAYLTRWPCPSARMASLNSAGEAETAASDVKPDADTILEEAAKVVHGPRRRDYGTPLDNHTRTAALWQTYLSALYPGIQITAEQVCVLNILQKISRSISGRITRDTLVDLAGYAANIELIQREREATKPQAEVI